MLRHLVTRVREMDELKADTMLAVAFAIAGILEAAFAQSHGHSRLPTAEAMAVLAVPLVWRRRHTMAAIVAFAAVLAVESQLDALFVQNLNTPFVAVLLLAYTAGRWEPSLRMWFELAALAAVALAMGGGGSVGDYVWFAIVLGCPALAGRGIRSRVLFQREMREEARRLESERGLLGERAVEDERARIASELQAVVANGVSAMVVQAEAVPRLFAAAEVGAAERALEVIEETGRDALAEIRRLLGVLRRDDDGPALAPQPTLAQVDSLVAGMKARGLDAEVTVQGSQVALSPGVDLAGYRVLQEALSSATRANGVSHAEVSIVYGDENVLVKVRDDRVDSDGLDPEVLRALRERVGLYGGALRAVGEHGGPGYEIEVRLPIGGPQ